MALSDPQSHHLTFCVMVPAFFPEMLALSPEYRSLEDVARDAVNAHVRNIEQAYTTLKEAA